MNVFNWSSPFVIEKVMSIMFQLLQPGREPYNRSDSLAKRRIRSLKDAVQEVKKAILKNKVRAISRMMKIYKTLREDHELIIMLKNMCPDKKIPRGLLLEGRTALMMAVDKFNHAKLLDIMNERRPPYVT